MKSVSKITTKDEPTNRFINIITDTINFLLKKSILPTTITTTLTTGNNTINHKLSKIPVGWIISDINGAANIYKVSSDVDVIILNSSANVTVTLLVF